MKKLLIALAALALSAIIATVAFAQPAARDGTLPGGAILSAHQPDSQTAATTPIVATNSTAPAIVANEKGFDKWTAPTALAAVTQKEVAPLRNSGKSVQSNHASILVTENVKNTNRGVIALLIKPILAAAAG